MTARQLKNTKQLSKKQAVFVKAKVEGKSNTEAAMIATGAKTKDVAKTQGHRLSTNVNVQEAIAEEFRKQGIDLETVLKPVAKALRAQRSTYESGELVFEGDDIELQLKGHDRAVKLMGLVKEQSNGVNILYLDFSKTQQHQYGIGDE